MSLRRGGIVSKMLALMLLTAWLRPCAAQSNELVMATTFSPAPPCGLSIAADGAGVSDDQDAQPHQRLAGTAA